MITLAHSERSAFRPKQIALLETFADQAVIAINNARLFDEVQARTAELTEALEQQKASAEKAIGVVGVARSQRSFADKELRIMQGFADQAVIAIQNARLFKETQTALVHQTASADILRVISQSPNDTVPVFEAIVQAAIDLVTCDEALVVETDGKELWNAAEATRHGLATDLPSARVPVDPADNLPSRVIVTKKMTHIPDWAKIDLPDRDRQRVQRLGNRATLALPLMRGQDCLGMLVFVRTRPVL